MKFYKKLFFKNSKIIEMERKTGHPIFFTLICEIEKLKNCNKNHNIKNIDCMNGKKFSEKGGDFFVSFSSCSFKIMKKIPN